MAVFTCFPHCDFCSVLVFSVLFWGSLTKKNNVSKTDCGMVSWSLPLVAKRVCSHSTMGESLSILSLFFFWGGEALQSSVQEALGLITVTFGKQSSYQLVVCERAVWLSLLILGLFDFRSNSCTIFWPLFS